MLLTRSGIALFFAVAALSAQHAQGANDADEISESAPFFGTWVEKYMTYEQDADGGLRQTDAIFLAEVMYPDAAAVEAYSAELYLPGGEAPLAVYGPDDLLSYTNGFIYSRKTRSFDSLHDLERAHPPGQTYVWKVTGPDGASTLRPIRIGGPEGETEIPKLTAIWVSQDGHAAADLSAIDPDKAVTFSWDPFIEGAPVEGSDFDDLHFLLVDNCHGEYVFTGGAPGGEKNVVTDYTVTSVEMPPGHLEPGMPYVVFLSRVNFRDFDRQGPYLQLAANSFAVELPFRAAGVLAAERACPDPYWRADYRFSRKSPREAGMVAWPTVQEIADRAGGRIAPLDRGQP